HVQHQWHQGEPTPEQYAEFRSSTAHSSHSAHTALRYSPAINTAPRLQAVVLDIRDQKQSSALMESEFIVIPRRPSPTDIYARPTDDGQRPADVAASTGIQRTAVTTAMPAQAHRRQPDHEDNIRECSKVDFDEVMAIDSQVEDDYEEPVDDLSDSDMYIGSVEVYLFYIHTPIHYTLEPEKSLLLQIEADTEPPPSTARPPARPTVPQPNVRPIVLPPAEHPQYSHYEKDPVEAPHAMADSGTRHPQVRPALKLQETTTTEGPVARDYSEEV
ncbi:hypothetical protein OSTOST_20935, partial [Ostertagia ostertagi]